MKKFFMLLTLAFSILSVHSQESLDSEVYPKVMASVYEIVVNKHEDKLLTYEKPLPFERLSFKIRNDKFDPIGTAFLLEDGSFFTAAHVINLYGKTVYDDYYIRDQKGDTYKIESIEKFSTSRDFIKFSVPSYKAPEGTGLRITKDVKLNTPVFAVGNALGEGIIIRNGTYTSSTFENKDGAWKWIRFSAAASPGNSGGPLVNAAGEVIGIITMKSENENLNYALPISEALEADAKGIVDQRYYYIVPNIAGERFYNEWKLEVSLPKKLAELHAELTEKYEENIRTKFSEIRREYAPTAEKGFTNLKGKAEIMFQVYGPTFPITLYLKDSGEWDYAQPKTSRTQLDENGFVEYGKMMGYGLCRIHRPDNITIDDLIDNPKLTAEYCIKAANLKRPVAQEQIRITSLGEPVKSDTYTDCWGRTWLVNYFSLDFADCTILTYSLPIPTGMYVMMVTDDSKTIYGSHYLDMEYIADNVYLRYGGKIKDWLLFANLSEKNEKLKSENDRKLKINIKDDVLNFTTGRFEMAIPKSVMNWNEETQITVNQGYERTEKGCALHSMTLGIFTDSRQSDYRGFFIRKLNKPEDDARDETKAGWNKILNQVKPYDGVPYNEDKYTYLDKRMLPEGIKEEDKEKAQYIYLPAIEHEGQNKSDEANAFYDSIMKYLTIHE